MTRRYDRAGYEGALKGKDRLGRIEEYLDELRRL